MGAPEVSGSTAYERYLRTDTLLSLQRDAEGLVDPDEMVFLVVQQSSELWLKLAAHDLQRALTASSEGALAGAVRLVGRSRSHVSDLTRQLDSLDHISPWGYQLIRTQLENGSGFSSPGWRSVRELAYRLGEELDRHLLAADVALRDVYLRPHELEVLYQLAEALVDLDTECMLWRLRHLKVVERLVGVDAIGVAGTPIRVLTRLTGQRLYPQLWQVRSELTEHADRTLADVMAVPANEAR